MKDAFPHVAASPECLILPMIWSSRSGCHRSQDIGGTILAMQGNAGWVDDGFLRQPEQNQRDGSRGGLDQQNPATDGRSAVDAGDDDTEQKEHLDLEGEAGDTLNQTPDQPGGEKAVIEPLVGGQNRGISRLLRCVSKRLQAQRPLQRNISKIRK
jgi:hypothetical protein